MASDNGPPGLTADDQDKPFSMVRLFFESGAERNGVALPWSCTPQVMDYIEALDMREDDVILATYPKCGTHWMGEILTLLRTGGKPPDVSARASVAGLLEMPNPDPDNLQQKTMAELVGDQPSPRLMVTHLALQLLPTQIWQKKPKVVYLSRDPRDALASLYSFVSHDPCAPSFNELMDIFCSEKVTHGPIWDHTHGFWEHRNDDNFLYLRFQDLKKDTAGCVAKIANFLGYDLSDEQLSDVVKYSSLAEMKAAYARIEEEMGPRGKFLTRAGGILPFLHKGVVGGWKALFTVAQSEQFQKYHDEQLKKFGDGFEF